MRERERLRMSLKGYDFWLKKEPEKKSKKERQRELDIINRWKERRPLENESV